MENLLLALIAILLVTAGVAFYALFKKKKEIALLEKQLEFLSAITDRHTPKGMEALSFRKLEDTPTSIIFYFADRIQIFYDRIFPELSMYDFGEYSSKLHQISDKAKKAKLLELLKESVKKLSPETLAKITTAHISNIPHSNYTQEDKDIINKGKSLIVVSALKHGATSNRINEFQQELKKGLDLLLNDPNNSDEEERILMNAEFIEIKKSLKS